MNQITNEELDYLTERLEWIEEQEDFVLAEKMAIRDSAVLYDDAELIDGELHSLGLEVE